MTMHLLGPQYSTVKFSSTKVKLTKTRRKQLQKEWRAHNKWLKQNHQDTIEFDEYVNMCMGKKTNHHRNQEKIRDGRSRHMKTFSSNPALDFSKQRAQQHRQYPSAHSASGVAAKTSIMDPHNLNRESEEVRQAVLSKSRRVAPAYNKGGYQFITDETDITAVGKKNVC